MTLQINLVLHIVSGEEVWRKYDEETSWPDFIYS